MREFATIIPTQVISADEAPGVRGTDESWDDDDIIDSVLRLVADHHRAVGAAIGKRSFSPSLAELRQSPLGQDLRLLAAAGYATSAATTCRRRSDASRTCCFVRLQPRGWSFPPGSGVRPSARSSLARASPTVTMD